MHRKLAPLAAALFTVTGAVQAQEAPTLYGVLDAYVGSIENTGGTLTQGRVTALNSGGMTTSFWGLRAAEDLGGGLKAIAVLESYLRIDTGALGRNDADPFWGRLAVVGIESSSWGTLTFGRHVTPYSLATTNFTPFQGGTTFSTAFSNVFRGNVQGDTRFNNSIRWRNTGDRGFLGDVVYTFGQEIPDGPNRHRDQGVDATVRYAAGHWSVVGGTRQINLNNNGNGRDQKAYMVGGLYDIKIVKVFGQVHDVKEDFDDSSLNVKRRTYEASIAIPVGVGQIWASAATTKIEDQSPTSSDRRKSWALAYDHPLSKRTDLYAVVYSDKQENPQIDQEAYAVGLRHRF